MQSDPLTVNGFSLEAEAVTRRGLSHENNQDAYLVDLEGGLFAVADGMGGHRDGHVASNAIVSVLARTLDHQASFEERIETATQALENVNSALYGPSADNPGFDISGSTALSLIIGEGYACCLWAGDSRLYLVRDGLLYLISEDHSADDGMLTRAVGSGPRLTLDRRLIPIQGGDTFLLCSDGLLKGMNETEMVDMFRRGGEGLADRLLAKSVAGGSSDDITLILVWVHEHGG